MHLKVALLAFLVVGCLAAPPSDTDDNSKAAESDPGSKPDDSKAADAISDSSQSGDEGDDANDTDLPDALRIVILGSGPLFPFRDLAFGNPFGRFPLPIPYNSFRPRPPIFFGPGPVILPVGENDSSANVDESAGDAKAPSGEETKPKSADDKKPKPAEDTKPKSGKENEPAEADK